ncbi:hypothetical protein ACPEIC_46475 [Stenotrophomonas sp. NPDC087984]
MEFMDLSALHVGNIRICSFHEGISDRVFAAFTDGMDVCRELSAEEAASLGHRLPQGLRMRELVGSGQVVADRLDAMGVTTPVAMDFMSGLLQELDVFHDSNCRACGPDSEGPRSCTRGYTLSAWERDIREAVTGASKLADTAYRLMVHALEEEHVLLRAVLSVVPEATIRLALGTEKHWRAWSGSSSAVDHLRLQASQCTPLVVLTEGRSDVAILEPAFAMTYPHLKDLVRWMDFAHRPAGGAGPLASTLRTFAAAGIANRVVGLFDNDTAGCDALRALQPDRLPANVKALCYPDLALGRHYPTIGPPTCDAPEGRHGNADINGAACSIELYLGRDLLMREDGSLSPVHWRSFVPGMNRYQGEIMNKAELQQAFRRKLRTAADSPSAMAVQDWSGLQAIFTTVLTAFL